MNTKSKSIIRPVIVLAGFSLVLSAVYFLAITYGMKNLQLFAFMIIAIPSICVAISAFLCGYNAPEWKWKRGILIGIVLAVLTYGVGTFSTNIFNVSPDSLSKQDALMSELYDELDRKAYEAMLEQGLISKGEEIYSGPVEGNSPHMDSDVAYSELYVGLSKSDTASEILSAVINTLLAVGAGFAGAKAKMHLNKRKERQNLTNR